MKLMKCFDCGFHGSRAEMKWHVWRVHKMEWAEAERLGIFGEEE